MKKQQIILAVVLLGIVGFIAFWSLLDCAPFSPCIWSKPKKDPPLPRVILSFVGPWDSAANWAGIAERFQKYKRSAGIDVIIEYRTINDQLNYEDIIREMQFEGNGPNIYSVFHSWVPRYSEKLKPMPAGIMTLDQYRDTFASVASNDLIMGGNIYALPFYIDTPILFYNQDKFLNEGYLKPPETWDEFKDYAEKLTILEDVEVILDEDKDEDDIITTEKRIKIAGATIGGGSNVNRSQDILLLLIMQNNIQDNFENLVSFDNEGTFTAIKSYTDFTNPEKRFYTWNEDQMYSIDAFSQRKAAMMINYSHHIKTVKNQTGNTLNFKVAPVPQLDKNFKANYASYWVPVVPKTAPCRSAKKRVDCIALSWEFLAFAAQKENAKLYLNSTNKAAANLELAQEQANNFADTRSVSASQVFTAKSWRRPNDAKADKVLVEMIDSIITKDEDNNKNIFNAMQTVKDKIIQLN